MYYVQYYNKGLKLNVFIEACGDRAVVILDGRNSISTMHEDAYKFNGKHRPNYQAYRIFKGSSFLNSQPITNIIPL